MGLCLLFGLLFWLLAFHREGVWTKYTPQDGVLVPKGRFYTVSN